MFVHAAGMYHPAGHIVQGFEVSLQQQPTLHAMVRQQQHYT